MKSNSNPNGIRTRIPRFRQQGCKYASLLTYNGFGASVNSTY